jgi:hypothetical protein
VQDTYLNGEDVERSRARRSTGVRHSDVEDVWPTG